MNLVNRFHLQGSKRFPSPRSPRHCPVGSWRGTYRNRVPACGEPSLRTGRAQPVGMDQAWRRLVLPVGRLQGFADQSRPEIIRLLRNCLRRGDCLNPEWPLTKVIPLAERYTLHPPPRSGPLPIRGLPYPNPLAKYAVTSPTFRVQPNLGQAGSLNVMAILSSWMVRRRMQVWTIGGLWPKSP